jgi:multidrug efflux system outer membrane protein
LNIVLGRDPATPVRLALAASVATATIALEPTSLPDENEVLELADEMRPELANGRATLEQQKKTIRIAEAAYYPTVSLGASWTKASRRPDRVFNDPGTNYTAMFGLDVYWPFFEGRATEASVQQETINYRNAETTFHETERQVRSDVLDALAQLRANIEVHKLSVEGAGAAEEAVRLAEGLYRQGKGTLLELRDAQLRLTEARQAAFNARYNIEVARENLRRAIGADPSGEVARLPEESD